MTKKPLSSIAQSKRRRSRHHISLPRMGKGDRVSGARVLSLAAQMRLSSPYTPFCLSYHSHPICPCGAPSPRGEGYDARIPSSKQAPHHPCEPIRSPKHRHPERSRGIFIALPPYVQMRPHSNDTLVLPFSPFPHPRFTGLQEGFLHFGRDDKQNTNHLT